MGRFRSNWFQELTTQAPKAISPFHTLIYWWKQFTTCCLLAYSFLSAARTLISIFPLAPPLAAFSTYSFFCCNNNNFCIERKHSSSNHKLTKNRDARLQTISRCSKPKQLPLLLILPESGSVSI